MVCSACCTVVKRHMDSAPEWRGCTADNDSGSRVRCGPYENDLVPVMGSSLCAASSGAPKGMGAKSSRDGHRTGRYIQRCQQWNAMTYCERTLYNAFKTLSLEAHSHGITPCILDEAKRLYKRIIGAQSGRSNNRQALIACSVYMAFKRNGAPRSLREVNVMFGIPPAAMTKACKVYNNELEGDVAILSSTSPRDFVARFCCKLDVDNLASRACRRVFEHVEDRDLIANCTPLSVVCGVILFCCVELRIASVTAERIGEVAHVSASTVKKSYRQLRSHAKELLPLLCREEI